VWPSSVTAISGMGDIFRIASRNSRGGTTQAIGSPKCVEVRSAIGKLLANSKREVGQCFASGKQTCYAIRGGPPVAWQRPLRCGGPNLANDASKIIDGKRWPSAMEHRVAVRANGTQIFDRIQAVVGPEFR
jgi:hypothetical protein